MAAGLGGEAGAFVTPNPADPAAPDRATRRTCSRCFPYPSGELHMGHVLNYTLGDVVAHVRRRRGFAVLRPMGYDAFGLPAENAAIREGGHPREVTERNIAAIRAQIEAHGLVDRLDARGLDARARVLPLDAVALPASCTSAGLAYRKAAPVKWCPNDQTVLANEQVIDGRCERCGAEVESREPRAVDVQDHRLRRPAARRHGAARVWPERVLTMQRNWIGRSEGARGRSSAIEELDEDVPVFTTRPDTLFGATFFVLAPEHPLVERFAERAENGDELRDVRAARRGREERGARARTRRRPASSPASTRSTPSTTSGSRSGSPTTC